MSDASISGVAATFVHRIRRDGLPKDAQATGLKILIDCLGAALGGASSRATQILHQYLSSLDVRGPSTILGARDKGIPEHAALANGLAAHVLDIDDTSSTMDGHPSGAALASSLAAAEAYERSGLELLTAFVIAFEVQAKISSVLPREYWRLGWHNAGTLGSIGAAAAAAFLLELDEVQTSHALGAAASMASGLSSNVGSMVKPLHPGLAARNGVVAAELARRGFEAQPRAIDGPMGFVQATTGDSMLRVDLAALAARLGSPFDVVTPGTDIKIHPSCNLTHPAVDAAISLHGVAARKTVREIVCRVPPLPLFLLRRLPRNRTEGKFSFEYCVALALDRGCLRVDDFEDGPIVDESVAALMQLVRVHPDPTMVPQLAAHQMPAEISVRFDDGPSVVASVSSPRGSVADPLTEAEGDAKFLGLAGRGLPMPQAHALLTTLRSLVTVANVRDLSPLLVTARH